MRVEDEGGFSVFEEVEIVFLFGLDCECDWCCVLQGWMMAVCLTCHSLE